MAGAAATALGLECAAFSRAGAGELAGARVNDTSPRVASNVAVARPPMAAQKPMPGITSKAPVATSAPPVACANGSSFAPVISTAAQIRPMMASAAEAKCDARWGINEAISPSTAQASTAMAMGARVFSGDGRRATGAGASDRFFCRCSNSCRALSATLPLLAGSAADVSTSEA